MAPMFEKTVNYSQSPAIFSRSRCVCCSNNCRCKNIRIKIINVQIIRRAKSTTMKHISLAEPAVCFHVHTISTEDWITGWNSRPHVQNSLSDSSLSIKRDKYQLPISLPLQWLRHYQCTFKATCLCALPRHCCVFLLSLRCLFFCEIK